MPLTGTGETTVLNSLLSGLFVSLHTADPTAGNEVSGGGYVRQSAAFVLSGANPTLGRNSSIVEFPVATATWGTITHFGLHDASTAGNLVIYNALTSSKIIDTDDIVRFLVDKLEVSID